MKILLYGINFAPECISTGKYTGELAEWLCGRGHDVRVVTAPPYYPDWRVMNGYSGTRYRRELFVFGNGTEATVWRCPLWVPTKPTGFRRIVHLASFALSSFPVVLRQALWKPDVVCVVAPTLFCAPGAWSAARLSSARAWLHVQDFELDVAFGLDVVRGGWLKRVGDWLERLILRRFDKVSTISEAMIGRLQQKGVEAGKATLFRNWADTDDIRPLSGTTSLQGKFEFPPGTVVVMYSGNMGEKQGLELVIEAARILESGSSSTTGQACNRDPGDVSGIQFVLCGEGSAKTRLQRLAEGLGNVHWLPLQPKAELNDLLNFADIHVLPQRARAADLVMPSKLTGMLASGRPVIATAESNTELGRVVQLTGVVVPPGDVGALVQAIEELAGQTTRREELGRAARQYAVEYLDRCAVLSRFEEELATLIAQ